MVLKFVMTLNGLFTGTTARNEAKRMRIEWLKLLIENELQ